MKKLSSPHGWRTTCAIGIVLLLATLAGCDLFTKPSGSTGSTAHVYGGYAYVPDGSNTVYKISSSGAVTPIAVGLSNEMISSVAVRE